MAFLFSLYRYSIELAIYALFGPVVVCAEILGSILAFMAPLIVNLYCHKPALGYESYPCGDQSRNVWWVALIILWRRLAQQSSCLASVCALWLAQRRI